MESASKFLTGCILVIIIIGGAIGYRVYKEPVQIAFAGQSYDVRIAIKGEAVAVSHIEAANIRESFALDLLKRLGNAQPTSEIVAFVVQWTLAEDSGTNAFDRFNPLNTTQTGFGETETIDGDGVKRYPDYEHGMAATLQTLSYASYTGIVEGLLTNNPELARTALINSPWAGSRYHNGVGWPEYTVQSTAQNDAPHGNPLGTVAYEVSQGYGVGTHAPADIWGGIDLAAPEGTPIVAVLAGTVRLTTTWPCGNGVEILSEHWRILYCHTGDFLLADGVQVQEGQQVAVIGLTGQTTGPHLHFEVWHDGVNVNPLDYL